MIAGTVNVLARETGDVGVQRQQPMLPVDRAQDAFALRHLQHPERRVVVIGWNASFSSQEMITAPGIDGRSRAWRHCS